MAKKPRLYQRLTRATASIGSYRSLWLGPDHLLVVTSTGYTEEYRRILFTNIQGIFTLASSRRASFALFWGFLAVLGAIIAAISYFSEQTPIGSLIVFGIGVVGLLWNHLLGPTCKVYVLTGVQTLQLPAVVRRRKAKKVLAKIELLIAAAQQTLEPAIAEQPAPAAPPPLP